MTDIRMRGLGNDIDITRRLVRADDIFLRERGPFNHHCAECGTLLIRGAGEQVPDMIVICPVCLTFNEPVPVGVQAQSRA